VLRKGAESAARQPRPPSATPPRKDNPRDDPFEHGRFERFGPSCRYRIERLDRDDYRFWLPGGFFFEVAA